MKRYTHNKVQLLCKYHLKHALHFLTEPKGSTSVTYLHTVSPFLLLYKKCWCCFWYVFHLYYERYINSHPKAQPRTILPSFPGTFSFFDLLSAFTWLNLFTLQTTKEKHTKKIACHAGYQICWSSNRLLLYIFR